MAKTFMPTWFTTLWFLSVASAYPAYPQLKWENSSNVHILKTKISPVSLISSSWVANVSSSNTMEARDLGYQGKIGKCYYNTFGDTFPCGSVAPQENCTFVLDQRNSGGLASDDPAFYADVFVSPGNRTSQPFVPHIKGESPGYPLGITNVLQVTQNQGVIFFLAGNGSYINNNGGNPWFSGAGVAVVNTDSNCGVSVQRTEIRKWYGNQGGQADPYNETWYGDHGTMIGQDGYLYAYGSIPGGIRDYLGRGAVGLARVMPAQATDITQYQYWNGLLWTSQRQYNPTALNAVFYASQGSVYWNPYYQVYMYFAAYGSGTGSVIYCLTSLTPQGPWIAGPNLFTFSQMPYRYTIQVSTGAYQAFYTPTILPKYSDPTGKSVMLHFTYIVSKATNDDGKGHQIITAIKVNFA